MLSDWDLLKEAFHRPSMWMTAGGIIFVMIVLLILTG